MKACKNYPFLPKEEKSLQSLLTLTVHDSFRM